MLELNHISKDFGGFSLRNISFRVEAGAYYVILGESGAGKSMILETIAGLIIPDKGQILLDGMDITRKKIQQRQIGLVFQNHSIFPHLSVSDNIAYSLRGKGISRRCIRERVTSISDRLEITSILHRRPEKLSGGELQRVALARTLIQNPRILLLDEPLASLDARIKGDLRGLLRQLHRSNQTILHVTHDYEEALSLATDIAVIHSGCVIQKGTPDEVFHHPASPFVARFIGIKNFLRASIMQEQGISPALLKSGHIIHTQSDGSTDEGFVLIRGEDILLSRKSIETSAVNNFKGIVREIQPVPLGMEVIIDVGFLVHALITRTSLDQLGLTPGMNIWVHFKATAVRFIPE